jgi:hypothetical protein
LGQPIQWFAPVDFSPAEMSYYAAQGNAQRIFLSDEFAAELVDWRIVRRHLMAAIPYVASGGFSGPQLYPKTFLPLLRLIDRAANRVPSLFGTRLLVVLEKR